MSHHLHPHRTNKMVDKNPKMSMIILNVNGLITQLRARDCQMNRQNKNYTFLQETHCKFKI